MSKFIKITPQIKEELQADFAKSLENMKMSDGKISFTKSFSDTKQTAKVYFTPLAWTKMYALLREFSSEVAWHGVADRYGDDEKNEYIISDILVYPQTVSGTNVEMDEEEYAKWIMENGDDERFFSIRMQGHSHVNMATSPSSVDLQHQADILTQVPEDGFYIFMIYNKRLEKTVKIYDMKKNIMFEDKDITVSLVGSEGLDEFIKEAKAIVRPRSYSYQKQTTCPTTSANQNKTPSSTPYNPLGQTPKYPSTVGSVNDPTKRPKVCIGSGYGGKETVCDDYDDDDRYFRRYCGGGIY